MKYEHPTIKVEEPVPGYYHITGIPSHQAGNEIAPVALVIAPSVPDDLLKAILADRAGEPKTAQQPPKKEHVKQSSATPAPKAKLHRK